MSPQAPESTAIESVETPEVSTPKKAKKARKAKAPAKVQKAKASANGKAPKKAEAKDRPDRSAADAPVQERRVAVVKMLRKVRAVDAESACPIGKLAEKLGYTKHDVYCLVFHQYPLVTEGFVSVAKGVPVAGICAYLTKKGQATDFDCEPFTK